MLCENVKEIGDRNCLGHIGFRCILMIEISGSDGEEYEESSLLAYCAM
jgi:hypothetical protein